ncbi:MAG: hypothetical protein Q9M23_00975 [Mariprofundaceae bacterium]|nr:hypothetical protein [Mariprofundaceae bacterium]
MSFVTSASMLHATALRLGQCAPGLTKRMRKETDMAHDQTQWNLSPERRPFFAYILLTLFFILLAALLY